MELIKMIIDMPFKAGTKRLADDIPDLSRDGAYITQYFGLWKVLRDNVKELNAKKVLEFGTREGWSTRIFAWAMKETGGRIITVDFEKPKFPEELAKYDNISVLTSTVEYLNWSDAVDILYIDDWHDPLHVYTELERFSKFARRIILHDVSLELGTRKDLMKTIIEWCFQNMAVMTYYPMNPCGMAVIDMEKSRGFYDPFDGR